MSHKRYRDAKDCLNCGAVVDKKFCPECGQENVDTHENFFHMAGHFVSDYLHYDSKFLKGLKRLFTRPGFLTREYWDGKRVSYIHPLRLFFFTTIIMVIMANLYYKKYADEIKDTQVVITDEKGERKVMSTLDMKNMEEAEKQSILKVAQAFDMISHYLKYISFFLLPLYALAFMFLYRKQKPYYVDHLIYTVHLQSFIYIILSVLLILPIYISPATREWFDVVLIGITAAYIIVSLRYLYRQSWIKTVFKGVLATTFMVLTTTLVTAVFIVAAFF